MSDLFKQYLKEREDLEVLEHAQGFATYKFRKHDCYIVDIYVVPEVRKEGLASKLADQIASLAKLKGYSFLTGSVDVRAKGADTSVRVLRAYGMTPYVQEGPVTYYKKEI